MESMDPGMIAINTVRGTAMHAAFKFLLWPQRLEGAISSDIILAILDEHLDAAQDPSLAVRSTFGWVFPALRTRFPEWAATHVDRTFPLDQSARPLLDSAWDVYLARWRPGPDDLALLRQRYELAIDRMGDSGGDQHHVGSLSTRDQLLAEHLSWLYVMGSMSLDDELLANFFSQASVELEAHATAYLGKIYLKNPPPTDEARERLRQWWDTRKTQSHEVQDPVNSAPSAGGRGQPKLIPSGIWKRSRTLYALEYSLMVATSTSRL